MFVSGRVSVAQVMSCHAFTDYHQKVMESQLFWSCILVFRLRQSNSPKAERKVVRKTKRKRAAKGEEAAERENHEDSESEYSEEEMEEGEGSESGESGLLEKVCGLYGYTWM